MSLAATIPESRSTNPSGWLARAPEGVLVVWALTASFAAYFSMYAFRKPFTAARFAGATFLDTGLDLKTALVLGQVFGYALSKFLGVRICSQARGAAQVGLLVGLVGTAQAALLVFALVPGPWKVLALFVNGLPLGMIWGLVVRYLEGRRSSDLLLAVLSTSYIVSSGAVKDVGRYLMDRHGVTEYWMPFLTGLLALPVFLGSVWMLTVLPPPGPPDVAARGRREPMDSPQRRRFLRDFGLGLIPLLVIYCLLTAYRDFRDNYGVEIFQGAEDANSAALFTLAEGSVALGVLVALLALSFLPAGRSGLAALFALMLFGVALVGLATWLHGQHLLGGFAWRVAVGLGSYLAYVPFGAVLFERLMAVTRSPGTAVFAITLADAAGYSAAAVVQMYKDLGHPQLDHLTFFVHFSYLTAAAGVVLLLLSAVFFLTLKRVSPTPVVATT
jgi:hypothetical protein